ncbi:MAG: PspC domain-containing protein [Rhodothermales bacterium]|nr:PspC domain-containing protein [Rhodothermales bacterium]
MSEKKIHRSMDNKMIAGVCAGLADYFEIDPTLVRVAYVLLSFIMVGFPGLILYIILAVVIPEG